MQQCFPVICASKADYFENIHFHSIKQHDCPMCKALKSAFGEGNSLSCQLRDYRLYLQKMILTTQGYETMRWEARQYLEHQGVGTSVSNGSGPSLWVRVRVQPKLLSNRQSGLSINPNCQLGYGSMVNSLPI